MVYVDALCFHPNGPHGPGEWCHMMADTDEELHAIAEQIGLRRAWFQGDHYDLRPEGRVLALQLGAVEVTSRNLVRLRRSKRGEGRGSRG